MIFQDFRRNSMSKQDQNWRQRIYNVVAGLLLIAGCICLFLGVLAAIDWRVTPALSLMGAALVLFFAATIERFETLKGLGMEAKLTTLDIKISEASRLLAQIKMVAEITGKASLSMYARTGRISGPPPHEEMYDLIQRVNESLVSIGSTPATIKDAIDPCTKIMQHDLSRAITKSIVKDLNEKQHAIRNSLTGIRHPDEVSARMAEVERLEEIRLQLVHSKGIDRLSFPENLVTVLRSELLSDLSSAAQAANEFEEFAGQMATLRQTGRLTNSEKWFARAREAYT